MEAHSSLLESLNEHQQGQVFEIMAIGNIEDVNVAVKLYIDSGYDMNVAIQRWLDRHTGGMEEHNIPATREPVANPPPADRGNQQQRPRNQESELHLQYKRYTQRKAREEEEKGLGDMIKKGTGAMIYGIKSVWNYVVPVGFRGETAGGEQFIMYYWNNYRDLYKIAKFNYGNFEDNAWYANNQKKPFLVYVHVDGDAFKAIPNNLFRNKALTDYMNNKTQLLGLLLNTEESQKITKYVETKDCPCLAVFRTNLLDEIVLLGFISVTNESTPEQVLERLRTIEKEFYEKEIGDNRIKQEVRRSLDNDRSRNMQMNSPFAYANQNDEFEGGQMFPFFGGAQQQQQRRPVNPEEQQRLEEARVLRQIQEEEFKEVERKIKEQQEKQAEEQKNKKEREEQEALTRRVKEEEDKKKAEQKEFTKQLKLGNIPSEPAEDAPDAVLIIFRLPDGNRTERRFRASDKVGVLYDYVDVQDIQFDSSTVRYDLMQPRPFLCLEEKEKTIGEYFEGSNNEVIHVRELTA